MLSLGLRLDVPAWVPPLVVPRCGPLDPRTTARHPARRLLMFASAVALALNVADAVVAAEYGKAASDAVGPLPLIGWGLRWSLARYRPERARRFRCARHAGPGRCRPSG